MDSGYREKYQAELDAAVEAAWTEFKADNPGAVAAHATAGHSDDCLRRTFVLGYLAGSMWRDKREIAKSEQRMKEYQQKMADADQRLAEIRDQHGE